MAHIYLHKLTVTVITTEESPDAIERLIDNAGRTVGMRIDARTDPDNRRSGPAIKIADAPAYPTSNLKADENTWADAHDQWLDSWPSLEAFNNQVTA